MNNIHLLFLLFLMFCNRTANSQEVSFSLSKSAKFIDREKQYVANQTSKDHIQEMEALGIEGSTIYYNLMDKTNTKDPLWWVQKYYLSQNIPTNIVLILKKKGSSSLELINTGYFDHELDRFSKKLVEYGTKVTLTILHESNGGWYPWGACYRNNNYKALVKSYTRINNILIHNNARHYVDLTANFNRRGCDAVFEDWSEYLPYIESIVDSYSISTYNRCGSSEDYKKEVSFETDFNPAYQALSAVTQKPINIGEIATSGLCGNSLNWYKNLLKSLSKYPQVKNVNFFFGDISKGFASNDISLSWGFEDKSEIRNFKKLLLSFSESKLNNELSFSESKLNNELPFSTKIKLPWDLQVFNTLPFSSPYSNSINRFTQGPFGAKQLSLLVIANQRLLIESKDDFLFGPGIKVTNFLSANDNQWWNNQIILEFNFSFLIKNFNSSSKTLWSIFRVEPYISYNYYFVKSPINAAGIETGIRMYIGIGGDWNK
jgi:hypothetical protein